MARSVAYARSRERVTRICASAADARTLRLRLLEELRLVVGFNAYAWVLTDPETSVGSAPLADVPCLPELPRLIALKYLTRINRWTTMRAPVALLQEETGGDPSRSLLWQGLLCRYGIGDVASLVFRDRFGCWGFLDLWKSGTSARFDQAEAAFLTDIAGPVTTALRRAQANAFAGGRGSREARKVGPDELMLSPVLDVLRQTPETQEYLRVLVPPAADRPPVPASAYNVAAQLLAIEADVDPNPPCARVHMSDGLWVTLRAARLGGSEAGQDGDIAVTIEETSPPERVALFALAFGLTARESELLSHLVTGADTRELARRMFLSEHTVQDHLKSMFAKTSAHNRRTLLSRVLG